MSIIFYLLKPRYQLSVALACWGLWLVFAHPLATSSTYATMQLFANDHQWGLLFFAAGLLGIAGALAVDLNRPSLKNLILRQLGATIVSTGWFFIFLLLWLGNWRSTASVIYGFVFIESLLNWVNLTGLVQIKTGRFDEC